MSSVHGLRRFTGTDNKGEKGFPVPSAVLDLKNLVFSQSAREEDAVEGKQQGMLGKKQRIHKRKKKKKKLPLLSSRS